jgi:hypothetical protein
MAKLVRKLADGFGLPSTFTLDACRHGGMTDLEEAELTTGQGRALSGHRTIAPIAVMRRPRAKGMPTCSRTLREQSFRMARGKRFRMAMKPTIKAIA